MCSRTRAFTGRTRMTGLARIAAAVGGMFRALVHRARGRSRRRIATTPGVEYRPGMGDHVRIRQNAVTEAAGIAGLDGSVFGESVPSSSGVAVIGAAPDDYVVNVYVTERDESYWLAPEHVEFLDFGAGQEFWIKGMATKYVRRADGGWDRAPVQ